MRCRNAVAVAMLIWGGLVWAGSAAGLWAGAPATSGDHKADEQAIRAAAQEYLAALARGDAKALDAFWTADADFIDSSGQARPARELIAEVRENKTPSAGPPRERNLPESTIRFLTADVALEEGQSDVAGGKGKSPPARGRFTAIWVKQEGKWRLASLREGRVDPPSTASHLAALDGMLGDWTAEGKEGNVEVSVHWNSTHNYLIRELKVLRDGHVAFSGLQRIGWDPRASAIRSWTFDSEGGHGEGLWMKDGDSWIIETSGVLPDGRQTSSINTLTPEGNDVWIWKSSRALADGESVPEMDAKLVRKPETK